jgi:hypothetical protein
VSTEVMPEVTRPQIIAIAIAGVPILATLARAFGIYDLSIEQEKALSDALTWAGVLAGSLIGGDAILRTGRNIRKGQVEAALVSDPSQTPGNVAVENSILIPAAGSSGTVYQPPSKTATVPPSPQ